MTQRYLGWVAELGLTCGGRSLKQFCEDVYPIDVTSENLARITDDGDDLLGLLFHPIPEARPVLLALLENSDLAGSCHACANRKMRKCDASLPLLKETSADVRPGL